MNQHRAVCVLVAAMALALPRDADAQAPTPAPDSIRAQIERRNASLSAAQVRGDAPAVAAHYSPSAVLRATPPGEDLRGRSAIEASFRLVFTNTRVELARFAAEHVRWKDGVVVESGHFAMQFRSRGNVITCERGSYSVRWRREEDGVWRIVEDRSTYGPELPPGPCPRAS